MRRNLIIVFAVLILVLMRVSLLWASPLGVGESVKPYTLSDVKGNPYNLDNSIGKRVTVIWVSDMCKVCASGYDNLLDVYKFFNSKNVDFYIISTVSKKVTESFIMDHKVSIPVLMGGNEPMTEQLTGERGYGLCPIINIFIIDKGGVLKYNGHLPGITSKDLKSIISNS